MIRIFFDTETTGLAPKGDLLENFRNFPHIVQIAWIIDDTTTGNFKGRQHFIKPDGWTVPEEAEAVHGYSTEHCAQYGRDFAQVARWFLDDCRKANLIIAHNIQFDARVFLANCIREWGKESFDQLRDIFKPNRLFCTMTSTTDFCKIPGYYGKYKWPKLEELYMKCFNDTFDAHDAQADTMALYKCYGYLIERKII